jgi:hypothetical protein
VPQLLNWNSVLTSFSGLLVLVVVDAILEEHNSDIPIGMDYCTSYEVLMSGSYHLRCWSIMQMKDGNHPPSKVDERNLLELGRGFC